MLFSMAAAVVAVCWGLFGRPVIAATAILMWGLGDAAAALVGIPLGRHKVPLADGKKSWEGSGAMLATSFVAGFVVLLGVEGISVPEALLWATLGAVLGTLAELFSSSELVTVAVPVAVAATLLVLSAV